MTILGIAFSKYAHAHIDSIGLQSEEALLATAAEDAISAGSGKIWQFRAWPNAIAPVRASSKVDPPSMARGNNIRMWVIINVAIDGTAC